MEFNILQQSHNSVQSDKRTYTGCLEFGVQSFSGGRKHCSNPYSIGKHGRKHHPQVIKKRTQKLNKR